MIFPPAAINSVENTNKAKSISLSNSSGEKE